MAKTKSIQDIKSQLSGFIGTTQYHIHRVPLAGAFKCTDGAMFVANECEAFWMLDLVASYQVSPKVAKEPFQVYKFKKTGDSSMLVTIEDGNKNELATQKIHFTDFPLDEIEMWFIRGVILLPSEY